MFWHNLKYELLSGFRVKSFIFWLMIWPIILGTLFKVAFGNVYSTEVKFKAIPTAVVEVSENQVFRQVIESLENADDPLLDVTYTDKQEAEKLLKDEKVSGIIYVDNKISLSVTEQKMQQVVLKTFVEQYAVNEKVITNIAEKSPDKVQAAAEKLMDDVKACNSVPATKGNTDTYIQYFYNLIAMVAIMGTVTGLHVTVNNQANLSALGARKNCSPTPKSTGLLASLTGSYIMQTVCMLLCVTFTRFVLKTDFGDRLPFVYLSAVLGGLLGVSIGFFFGSLNQFSFEVKSGIILAVSMFSCFLSGLMLGNMKGIIAERLPWLNKVNPATVISDSFYTLNMYDGFEHYTEKVVLMLVLIVAFTFLGIIVTRRKKYASL